ncbi:3-hydroxyacyl-CoA dehydrogenase family protein [Nocardia gamkensis]|uniref:3-hydroxyacyl-CoA dehydrogenase family protein n=1 Tax=Nocardia gamkensis TaxID=352869 RepID=UPI0037C69A4B
MEIVAELTQRLGKIPVVLNKETPGFVANRILNAIRDEAISLLEGGVASVEAIDVACSTALGYPVGPFELMDLTGIDIGYYIKQERFAEVHDPADAPSRSVVELVERGISAARLDAAGTSTTAPVTRSHPPRVRRVTSIPKATRKKGPYDDHSQGAARFVRYGRSVGGR